jgi:hypothetical protein
MENHNDLYDENPVMTRYLTHDERNRYFVHWIKVNGFPSYKDGCVCCAESVCLKDCQGIYDERVRKMFTQ